MAPPSMFHGHHFIEVRLTIVYEIPYISRLSYQHCIHDRLSATIFGTHIWIDSNQTFFDPPDPKGGARGAFRGSTIQKSGKCHELPRKSIIKKKKHPTPGGPSGDFRGLAIQKVREMSWTAQKINNLFNPRRTLWLGALGLNITRGGGSFLGTHGGREGGMRKVGVRVLEGRKVGGCRRKEGRREGGGREVGWRTKVGVRGGAGRAEDGRKEEGGDVGGSRDEEGREGRRLKKGGERGE